MASSEAPKGQDLIPQLQIDDECYLCKRPYHDPRLLHCHHSFCLLCITDYTLKQTENELECPRCSKPFTLPRDGVRGLRKAITTASFMLETITSQLKEGSLLCDVPECRKANRKAVMYCNDGCGLVCEECLGDHKSARVLKLHQLTSLGEMKESGWVESAPPPYCDEPEHGQNHVDGYCLTLQKMICVDCIRDEVLHKRCQHHKIQNQARTVKEDFIELVNKANRYTTCLDNIISATNREGDQAKQAISEMEREIEITASKLHSKTDEDKNQGLRELAGDQKKIEDEARKDHAKVDERKNKLLEENARKQKKLEDDTRSAHIKIDEDKKQLLEQLANLKKQILDNIPSEQTEHKYKAERVKNGAVRVLEDTEDWRVVEANAEMDLQKQYTTIADTVIPTMSLKRITPSSGRLICDKSPTAGSEPDKTPGCTATGGNHDNCVGELSVEPCEVQSGRAIATPVRDINLKNNTMITGIVSMESDILVTHLKYNKLGIYNVFDNLGTDVSVPDMENPSSMTRMSSKRYNVEKTDINNEIIVGDFDGKLLHFLTISSDHNSIQNHKKVKLEYRPHDVSVDAETDTITVTNKINKRLHTYNIEGTQQRVIPLLPADSFENPGSCVHVPIGFVVADYGKNQILWVSDTGHVTQTYGTGPDHQKLNHPLHVALTGCGNILVVDSSNHRVQLLDQTGHFLGHVLEEYDGLRLPTRVHVDTTAGKLYVGYWPKDDKRAIKVANFTEMPTKHTTFKVNLKLADI